MTKNKNTITQEMRRGFGPIYFHMRIEDMHPDLLEGSILLRKYRYKYKINIKVRLLLIKIKLLFHTQYEPLILIDRIVIKSPLEELEP